jgi:hypothetical protein
MVILFEAVNSLPFKTKGRKDKLPEKVGAAMNISNCGY